MKLIVSEEATADLEGLREFLADKDPAAARRAVAAIVNAVRSLAVFPSRGRPLENAGTRDLVVPFGDQPTSAMRI